MLAINGCTSKYIPQKQEGILRNVAVVDCITEGLTSPEHNGHSNSIEVGLVKRLEQHFIQNDSEKIEVFNEGIMGDTIQQPILE